MEINSSSFIYGQQGLQRSQDKLDQASQKVASASLPAVDQEAPQQPDVYGSQIKDGLIEAKSSVLEAQANANVIEASDKTIGRLIDITV
ncbi:hypothetical protein [Marinomonas foliarum]|uniref:Flagellar basal body rod FlgEFG protein n=1 Tax=Marinomonas foliarum TaxID=491950 RepID=A0ABX7ILU5_9GAMM|nr:hypothetical protein [Marinomonas foliarum]QRV23285.1 hypothetical protein JSY38_14645 [Marinomonas foliarum]